jgi:hypothetical protein
MDLLALGFFAARNGRLDVLPALFELVMRSGHDSDLANPRAIPELGSFPNGTLRARKLWIVPEFSSVGVGMRPSLAGNDALFLRDFVDVNQCPGRALS